MSTARDFDDWRIMRRSRERGGAKWMDPMPPGGLCEDVYCGLMARYGYWAEDFLLHVKTAYRGVIPKRFHDKVARLAAEKAWEVIDEL